MSVQSEWTFEVAPARPAQEGVPAAGPVYRSTGARDGPPALEGASTCYELFHRSVELYADRPCLGSRKSVDGQSQPFTYMTYAEAGNSVSNIGSAMQAVGLKPHDRAGVFGANSPEWMLAMQVLLSCSLPLKPLCPDFPSIQLARVYNSERSSALCTSFSLPGWQSCKSCCIPVVICYLGNTLSCIPGSRLIFLSCRHAIASQYIVYHCMIPLEKMPSSTLWTMHPVPLSLWQQSSFLAWCKPCPVSSTPSRLLSSGAYLTRSPSRSAVSSVCF